MLESSESNENNVHTNQPTLNALLINGKQKDSTIKQLTKYHLIYSIIGCFLGFICIIGGVVLFIMGITGNTNWKFSVFESKSEIVNAAPGVILFVVGLIIIFITRLYIKLNGTKN